MDCHIIMPNKKKIFKVAKIKEICIFYAQTETCDKNTYLALNIISLNSLSFQNVDGTNFFNLLSPLNPWKN